MANKRGTGLMIVWVDVPADKEDEFNRWYNEEHLALPPGRVPVDKGGSMLGSGGMGTVYEAEQDNPARRVAVRVVGAVVVVVPHISDRDRAIQGRLCRLPQGEVDHLVVASPVVVGDVAVMEVTRDQVEELILVADRVEHRSVPHHGPDPWGAQDLGDVGGQHDPQGDRV